MALAIQGPTWLVASGPATTEQAESNPDHCSSGDVGRVVGTKMDAAGGDGSGSREEQDRAKRVVAIGEHSGSTERSQGVSAGKTGGRRRANRDDTGGELQLGPFGAVSPDRFLQGCIDDGRFDTSHGQVSERWGTFAGTARSPYGHDGPEQPVVAEAGSDFCGRIEEWSPPPG